RPGATDCAAPRAAPARPRSRRPGAAGRWGLESPAIGCAGLTGGTRPGAHPVAEPRPITPSDLRPRLERAFDFAARQVRATVARTPDYFPMYTQGGRWK